MQIMAEALGLALPGTALMPATSPDLLDFAREAGRQAVRIAVAKVALFLASDLSSYVSGQVIHCCGAMNC